jgi:hypothetical protein
VKRKHKISAGLAGAIAALAALVSVTITLTTGGGAGVTITLGGPHGTPQKTVTVPKTVAKAAAKSGLDDHDGLRTENPPGVPAAQLDASRVQQEALAASSALPNVTPDAAPQQRGCTTRLVLNYSSRRGVPPRIFVLHYTVSPNRDGWSDVYSVAGLFDRPAFQASSNYIIDNEGHCLYIVRESDKAWTQAAANPFSVSVETINSGHEATYAGVDGLKKIALVAHDVAHRWHFPIQEGLVQGCQVVRPGIVDHHSLGACGGGHFDITPFSTQQVVAAARALDGKQPIVKRRHVGPKPCSTTNIQRALHIGADGVVGPQTRAAIRTFKVAHHLPANSVPGPLFGKAIGLAGCHG